MKARGPHALGAVAVAALCLAAPAGAASADVFNGRIAFASQRADPATNRTDIFSVNPDGTGILRLTTNPADDRQPDWSPEGLDIAYSISKPGAAANFEVSRMTASGADPRRLTITETGQASSQPSWLPDASAIMFRRSGPGRVASIWQMGPLGQDPKLRFATAHPALYPASSPDMQRVTYAGIVSPPGTPDADRGIFALDAGGAVTTLFDFAGAFDSAPSWSPDGRRIAFESNADVRGANPEGDLEIWTMDAGGRNRTQLTSNAAHDEGPVWSPDGRMLAFTSGPDDTHGDIYVMTAGGRAVRRLTFFAGRDESPDWQAVRAPRAARRCGDAVKVGRGAHDVRVGGPGLSCADALALARRWKAAGRPRRIAGFAARVIDFGGTRRVVLSRRGDGRRRVVAFLYQPSASREMRPG